MPETHLAVEAKRIRGDGYRVADKVLTTEIRVFGWKEILCRKREKKLEKQSGRKVVTKDNFLLNF